MADITYQSVVKSLYKAVLLQVIGGILATIFGIFDAFSSVADIATAAATGDATALLGGSMMGVLSTICNIVVIVATLWFFISLGNWKKVVDAADVPGVQKLWLASLLAICGAVIGWIPVIGIVGSILALVALILQLMGFAALKNSATLPEGARGGAKKLFTALIISIIGSIVGWIPLLGWIGGILGIIALILQLVGWKRIANS